MAKEMTVRSSTGTAGRRVAAAVASVALVAFTTTAAGGAASPDTPERAALLVIGELAAGNSAAAWPHLHPAQQRVVPLKRYEVCRAEQPPLPLDAANTRVLSKAKTKIQIPGTKVKASSLALTVKVALTTGQSQNIVVQEIRAKNSWRYVLNQAEVTTCRKA